MTTDKIRISALSYSNTFPFVFGLKQKLGTEIGEIDFEVPARTAERFRAGEVDIALVPVGALPTLGEYQIITNYCIGAKGPVKTVCLYSQVPLNEIKRVFLDIESRSSVRLVRILSQKYWKIAPVYSQFSDAELLNNDDAVVFIGDKTFGMSSNFKYTFDLAGAWWDFTGLPFVFAVWISKKDLPSAYITKLNEILKFGIDHIPEIYLHFQLPVSRDEYQQYIEHYIDYQLDEQKMEAMRLFLEYIKEMNL